VLAKLQFHSYHVTDLEYRFDPFHPEQEGKFSPEFNYNIEAHPENKSEAWVSLSVSLGNRDLENNSIFISATIVGYFQVVDEEDEESINNFFKINALAILYPYLRSVVSDATSKGTESPIILPTLNIVALMQDIEQRTDEISHVD
jgi:preprotein translocase subunit SecB